MAAAMEVAQGLESGLGFQPDTKLEVFTEFLDSGHFSAPEYTSRMAEMLAVKYADVPLDAIATVGPEALRFLLEHRALVARSVPVVFGDVSERTLRRLMPPPDMRGVVTDYEIDRTVDLAIGLQPDATRIVVIAGSSDFDRYWIENARRELGSRYRGIHVDYLTGSTLDEFIDDARVLAPQTILLILTVFEDAAGRKYRPREAAERIAAAAGAPSYGMFSSFIGSGLLGGYVATYRSIGRDIAGMVAKVLARDETGPRLAHASNQTVVDWRQLQRWGLDAGRLPADAELLHYDPSVWHRYRWQIVLIGIALLAESLALLGLLYERSARQNAERIARHRLLEVVHLNQSATAGALSASIAHELNQPLGAIRNNAAAAEIILRAERPDLDTIRQILADIRDDDQRASDIIQRLRSLLKKRGDIDWQDLDINEVVTGALHILRGEAERRSVLVDFVQTAHQLFVRADRVHLQQVILNLATNAIDAMLDINPAHRKLSLTTALDEGSNVAVSVADTGKGIPRDQLGRVFETFYTTKVHGTGLGLPIARTIVETYGGKIWADNRPEGGTVVRFVLPQVRPR